MTLEGENSNAGTLSQTAEPAPDLENLRSLEQALADLRRKHSQIADRDADKATLERMIGQLEAEIEERGRRRNKDR